MSLPVVVIISGHPCSGKTTLGLRLGRELNLAFIHKDGIKELLFDRLGWKDREWSRLLSLASYDLMDYFLRVELTCGHSMIMESNFLADRDSPRFQRLMVEYPFQPVQVLCQAGGEVLLQRFQARMQSGERHPGHLDGLLVDELHDRLLQGELPALDLPGPRFEVDTTDFNAIDYANLIADLRSKIG